MVGGLQDEILSDGQQYLGDGIGKGSLDLVGPLHDGLPALACHCLKSAANELQALELARLRNRCHQLQVAPLLFAAAGREFGIKDDIRSGENGGDVDGMIGKPGEEEIDIVHNIPEDLFVLLNALLRYHLQKGPVKLQHQLNTLFSHR